MSPQQIAEIIHGLLSQVCVPTQPVSDPRDVPAQVTRSAG
jgi:hypothetical protein